MRGENTTRLNSDISMSHRLKRGLSKTSENLPLVCKARDLVLQDIYEGRTDCMEAGGADPTTGGTTDASASSTGGATAGSSRFVLPHLIDTPVFTFVMPDLTAYKDELFSEFLHKDLVETSALVSLEQAGRLNWWTDVGACQRLLPLATTGDGNCLLHAASLGMWGFHDRKLILRNALFATLKADFDRGAFYRRWRWRQIQINKQSGLIYNENEWLNEWNNICEQASSTPRLYKHQLCKNAEKATGGGVRLNSASAVASSSTATTAADLDPTDLDPDDIDLDLDGEISYESLEELHVFVLAHALRRPIVIVADTVLKTSDGEPLAPIPFGGLYLPLECEPADCHRSPLLLTYDAAHFSALVAVDNTTTTGDNSLPAAIPLIDPALSILLPIHFDTDPGADFSWTTSESPAPTCQSYADRRELISRYLKVAVLPAGVGGTPLDDASKPNNQRRHRRTPSNTSVKVNDFSKPPEPKRSPTFPSKHHHKILNPISLASFRRKVSRKLKRRFLTQSTPKSTTAVAPPTAVTASSSVATPLYDYASDNLIPADAPEDGGDPYNNGILCAMLVHRRLDYQSEIVDNYIAGAKQRFLETRLLRAALDKDAAAPSDNNEYTNGSARYQNIARSNSNVKKKDAYSLNIADNYGDKYSAEKHEYAKFSHRANLYEGGGATCNNNAAAAAAASRCRTLPINVGASTSSANLCADDDDDLEAYNPCGGGGGGMDSLASSYDNLTVAPSLRERCRGTDCEFYGSSNTLFLCSLCYKRREWA